MAFVPCSREPTLSAEPLVGLKRKDGMVSSKALLSAEPLVGLKRGNNDGDPSADRLSAEPLVGLKPIAQVCRKGGGCFQPNPSWV